MWAIASFFDPPRSRIWPAIKEANQAWLLNETAFGLRALGRLTEAIEPMRAGLERYVKQALWERAARSSTNLSQTELMQGEVVAAVRDV